LICVVGRPDPGPREPNWLSKLLQVHNSMLYIMQEYMSLPNCISLCSALKDFI